MRSCLLLFVVGAHAAQPKPGTYQFTSAEHATIQIRHCDYQCYATPNDGSDDFNFNLIPALNGDPNGFSLQSVNFPDHYFTIITGQQPGRLGIDTNVNNDDASFSQVAGLSNPSMWSLQSLSKGQFGGQYVTLATSLSGGCAGNYQSPSGDVYLAPGTDAAASTWNPKFSPPPAPPSVTIQADNVTHAVNRRFMGCHSDSGYTQQPRGFYSQLIFGESFETQCGNVNCVWNDVSTSGAQHTHALDRNTPFNTKPSMKVTFTSGTGVAALSNRGIGNEGMVFQANKPYEGYIYAQAATATQVLISLTAYESNTPLDAVTVTVPGGAGWTQLNFTLTPKAATTCVGITPGSNPNINCGNMGGTGHICVQCGGEFSFGLTAPGSVNVGYTFLQPGPWGRLAGLPVLLDTIQTLQSIGITAIRNGGTFSQVIAWKDWRGPAVQRPSMQLTWGGSLISGWGPFDMIEMCEAAGFEPIITLREDQSNEDWADLVEYCYGNSTTTWGAQRIADGHPAPYKVHTFELGNEQYNNNFVAQVAAMEARAAALGVAGTINYMFPTNNGLSAADAAKAQQAGLPIQNIMPDIHVGAGGAVEVAEGDFNALPDFPQSAINCETNAGDHGMNRALGEAADLNDFFNTLEPVIGRIYARTASFCTERSGHYDAFDQGITFFLPNGSWIQPPGYVHTMITNTWANQSLNVVYNQQDGQEASVRPGTRFRAGSGAPAVSISAQKKQDGSQLVVRVTNSALSPSAVYIAISGATVNPTVTVWQMTANNANAANAPSNPTYVSPQQSQANMPGSGANVTVPGLSITNYVYTIVGA